MIAIILLAGIKLAYTSFAYTPAGMRDLPDPLYGVTVDSISNTADITASSRALPHMPTTRIVFDGGVPASNYVEAVNAIQPDSYIMGEIVDSSGLANITAAQYHDRTAEYLKALGDKVDIWEVGNEVNGSWTGPYGTVGAKIFDAHTQVKAAGKRSALTLWYNPGCPSIPAEVNPIDFSQQYVPAGMRPSLDYVFVSYYEVGCNNYRPSAAEITTLFSNLHTLYPNSKLGFGEVGIAKPVTADTQAAADSILKYYYGLHIDVPGYVGGYFWWNYYEDMLPTSKPMWQELSAAFTTVAAAAATPTPNSPKPGDIDRNNVVDVYDLSLLLAKWGTADAATDLNHDGKTDIFDLSILLRSWG